MKTIKTQNKLSSITAFGITVSTCINTQRTTAFSNGTLIYKKNLCGGKDLGEAHLNNVLDFMKLAKVADLRKPLNF